MKKFILAIFGAALFSGLHAGAQNNYGLPENVQEGNILHCFDWKFADVKNELPNIAAAGFGAVQVSPVQASANSGYNWSDLYRPYDFTYSATMGLGTKSQLQSLCDEAAQYGIKIIMDVVFNHVDTSKHSTWWNSNGRLRTNTATINYNNRTSITHDRLLAQCPETNTENPEVIAKAKEFIQSLHDLGVRGIRFDAAKHIELPSEGSDFWKEVTSVPDMYYYGEILGTPGGSNSTNLLKEYATYMSITDESYSNSARTGAGVPSRNGNFATSSLTPDKCVYWGESHDTYSNAGGASKNVSQAVIDRAYAILACRQGPTALYFSRPSEKDYGAIRVGQKGSTHFTDPQVAEVNKFRNAMVGKADAYSQNGSTASVTRQNGGAVVVNKVGAGSVSVPNGNGYCPAGTYVDRVSGNTFTVTAETITGTVGSSGIAVLYNSSDTGVDDVFESDSESNVRWFNLQGVEMVGLPDTPGIYIKAYPSGKTKKIII